MARARRAPRAPDDVLGYLLKHAHLDLEARTDAALEPFDLNTRELGALRVIAGGQAASQQDVAAVLGVDRSSMVAMLDTFEAAGIVAREPSAQDRRRNTVVLTAAGRERFDRAEAVALRAEREFTTTLGVSGADELRDTLRRLLSRTG